MYNSAHIIQIVARRKNITHSQVLSKKLLIRCVGYGNENQFDAEIRNAVTERKINHICLFCFESGNSHPIFFFYVHGEFSSFPPFLNILFGYC